ncbi:uncharacterized protein LOC122267007 [Penaeus japonicus]|uniref:uncharacterized protein LOC122267007 n=1 Tax=Penaeus japonicus TaxID=27405 RepID=UPI001C70DE66|nr:uncharacterized protein LOC122267007 [Penaeus japonicus]
MRMLRCSLRLTRRERVRSEYIRGKLRVPRLQDKLREGRLIWYGHVQRRDEEYVGRRVEGMEIGRRQGRPKRRLYDSYHENMREVGVTQEDAQDRISWRQKIRTGNRKFRELELRCCSTMLRILSLVSDCYLVLS